MFNSNRARERRARRLNPALAIPSVEIPAPPPVGGEPFPLESGPYVEPVTTGYHGRGTPSPEGEAVSRRRIVDPLEHRERVIEDLEGMPLEKQTGWQRVGRMMQRAGETMLESPARSSADLATNAIRGFARGAPMLMHDNAAREARGEELAQHNAIAERLDRARQRRAARAQRAAQTDFNKARARALANPQPEYDRVETADGYVYVDKNNPAGRQVPTGLKPPPKPGARPQTVRLRNEDGSESVYERGSDNVWKDTGLKSAGQLRRRVQIGGETFELPEAEAARVLAQIQAANITADAQGGANQVEADNKNAENRWKAEVQAWEQTGGRVDTYNTLATEGEALRAQLLNADKVPEKDRDPVKYAEVVRRHDSIVKQLAELERVINPAHAQRDGSGRYRMASQPAPPEVKAKPAPARRSGGAVPKVRTITAQSTETEVREAARALGKDEEAAVAKWRSLPR